jgi:hypothetical protein
MNVGIYCLVLALAKGIGLFVLRNEEAGTIIPYIRKEQSRKNQIRFVMRLGRFLELFLLLCFTLCLSMAASSPCDVNCGRLRTLVPTQ